MMHGRAVALACAVLAAALSLAAETPPPGLDRLSWGDPASEQAHALAAERSDTVVGGLGEPARRLLPLDPPAPDGGRLAFTMAVDPERQTYLTARLWGSDRGSELGRLYLFCEGKQVGYRHQGDVDFIDCAGDAPACLGRFFYKTLPIPLSMTRGKTSVPLEIRATGRIWPYGETYEIYQKVLKQPTRGIYRVYTHTDPCFVPPADEKQGDAPANPPARKAPGEEVLDKVKARVNRAVDGLVKAPKIGDLLELTLLARAYHVGWTSGYHKDAVVQRVVAAVDDLVQEHLKNKDLVARVPKWRSFGPAGYAIRLLGPQLKDALGQSIDHDGDPATPAVPRREAWSALFLASLDYRRTHRVIYTNQAMISDLNLYRSNRGLAVVDPARAMPEEKARRYLYEAAGLQPWLGSDTPTGSEKPVGEGHFLVTAKGLTKELGYVGSYGEILDWAAKLYAATCDGEKPGDERLKAQLLKLSRARAVFRYPWMDADGCRAMALETVVGWRDGEYPGAVVYGARTGWEGTATCTAALLKDPVTTGYARQCLDDNQFFDGVEAVLGNGMPDATLTLLGVPDELAAVRAQPPGAVRLPMSDGQPDFAWADEEDGVLALKRGDERLYVSLYWRAYFGINRWARVHCIGPRYERLATVQEDAEFVPSGKEYTLPDWTDKALVRGFQPPGDIRQAFAGLKLPVAAPPPGIGRIPGQGDPFAGRASFYACRYGPYLIGMNASKERTYELKTPAGVAAAPDLVSGKTIPLGGPVRVPPMSTVVLYLGR
jgi:hypothetical protein